MPGGPREAEGAHRPTRPIAARSSPTPGTSAIGRTTISNTAAKIHWRSFEKFKDHTRVSPRPRGKDLLVSCASCSPVDPRAHLEIPCCGFDFFPCCFPCCRENPGASIEAKTKTQSKLPRSRVRLVHIIAATGCTHKRAMRGILPVALGEFWRGRPIRMNGEVAAHLTVGTAAGVMELSGGLAVFRCNPIVASTR